MPWPACPSALLALPYSSWASDSQDDEPSPPHGEPLTMKRGFLSGMEGRVPPRPRHSERLAVHLLAQAATTELVPFLVLIVVDEDRDKWGSSLLVIRSRRRSRLSFEAPNGA